MVMDCVSTKQTDDLRVVNYGIAQNWRMKVTKQAKNEIIEGNFILSACEVFYREIFVFCPKTVRLN